MSGLLQIPPPGARLLRCTGDFLEVTLSAADGPLPSGEAFVRTSIPDATGDAGDGAWRDIPMRLTERGAFTASISLPAVGTFALKALFLPRGASEPHWPHGGDVAVKVAPAHTRRSNSIYTAFVRQFSPDDGRAVASCNDAAASLDGAGWSAIPPSGTFRELARRLDHIIGGLGFHNIQLLPIHPVPTTYARMGRFGSPFASRDFFDVDPALAEFDTKATPMDQFVELADAIHARGARLLLDLPANHTGWASTFQTRHPEWFKHKEDGAFLSPGAWGVTWEDLVELDYSKEEVADAMADVFLFWCTKGADGFRCDAGYMVPASAWTHIIGKVRRVFPDTVFMLEGLGGKLSTTDHLLAECGMDWAYSELFQQYDRGGVEWYLSGALQRSEDFGPLVSFAETHDNDRLASHGNCYAKMRTALAALFSQQGAFGITAGVEWFCRDKIDVHGAPPLNWGAAENQVAFIAKLNEILDNCEAFALGAQVRLVTRGGANAVAALRSVPGNPAKDCLVAVNLNCGGASVVEWPADRFSAEVVWDLITGKSVVLRTTDDGNAAIELPPGGAVALARANLLHRAGKGADGHSLCCATKRSAVRFRFPTDSRRVVMVPPRHSLRIESVAPFRALALRCGQPFRFAQSAPIDGSGHAATIDFSGIGAVKEPLALDLSITGFGPEGPQKTRSSILLLPSADDATLSLLVGAERLLAEPDLQANLANRRGAAAQVCGRWGEIRSQYDALLALNPDPAVPASRQIFFTRCRAWIRFRGFSYALDAETQTGFGVASSREARWNFSIPGEGGAKISIGIALKLAEAANRVKLVFSRHDESSAWHGPVTLVLRPDIEARDFHSPTRAYQGPENVFPAAVRPKPHGFSFSPAGFLPCEMAVAGAEFRDEPQWTYCVAHPVEARRGLEPDGDLFSPGWFSVALEDGGEATLEAGETGVSFGNDIANAAPCAIDAPIPFPTWMDTVASGDALGLFIADRDENKTVLAGFPWFLDWGRDTLIFLRGLIAAGSTGESLETLREFARFEEGGTLPNIIHGNVVGNRDTSDAPLWFIVAANDLMDAIGRRKVAEAPCGERKVADAMLSIVRGYISGTHNGVKVDPESGLVFSPPHFTWMDTNYPAGTPRTGYPVEIQALWLAALKAVRTQLRTREFATVEEKASASFSRLFAMRGGWLADCLRTPEGTFAPAAASIPEDALRPNQLLAVTLGALPPDSETAKAIVDATALLLVPGSIRSLDDAPVKVPQPVWRDGSLLNDPERPYWGHYEGDEDTRRKPAYHNGTTWGWQFPLWCEAMALVVGDKAAAEAVLASASILAGRGSLGQLPEICDGDAPHEQRGCLAQAWSLSELVRVWKRLRSE